MIVTNVREKNEEGKMCVRDSRKGVYEVAKESNSDKR